MSLAIASSRPFVVSKPAIGRTAHIREQEPPWEILLTSRRFRADLDYEKLEEHSFKEHSTPIQVPNLVSSEDEVTGALRFAVREHPAVDPSPNRRR